MANNTNAVDAVVAQEALKQVDSLIVKLSAADAELIKISESALKAGKNISSISTPGGMDKAVSNTLSLNDALAKQNKTIESLQAQITKLSQVRAISNKMSAEEAVNQRILNQNALTQAKSVSNLVGEYDKLNLQHQKAFKNAQNLGAQYGATSKQFLDASEKANKLDERLKILDSTLGKNTRNVGNYPGKFNALGNSISQLSREMPAFANSAQTGFMAISNNIPAFQDAITQMRSGGASWKEVLKGIGSSLFGLTGIISIATTALVVLGPKLIDWITNTDKEKEATDRLVASMKKQNEELRIYNDNIAHQSVLAIENAKQRGASLDEINALERKGVEDQLKNFERVRDSRKKDFDDFVNTEAKKRMSYFANPVGFAQRLEKERELIRKESSLQKNALTEAENAVVKQGFVLSELVEKQQTKRVEDGVKNEEKFNSEVLKLSEKFTKEELKALAESEHDKYRLLVESSFNELDLAIKTDTEKIKQMKVSDAEKANLLLENAKNAITARRNISNAMIAEEKKLLTKESNAIADLTKGLAGKTATIKDVDKSGDDAVKALEKQQIAIDKTKKSMEELHKATSDWIGSFTSDVFQNSGLGSLETFFDGTFNKLLAGATTVEEKFAITFNAVTEGLQEIGNFMAQNSEANFNKEKSRLQEQYDISLKYAGDNKAAQEKLAEDLEKSKKDIANREAKAKQKQAIFNIAIDTAQAIIGLWAKPGFPAAIPLAITVGAIGLAQAAMVASQEIPQYWMGGTHDGGLMMVNDGAGSNYKETIVTPDGKVMKPQGRNVIMDAPKGTEIYTHDMWQDQLHDMLMGKGISMSNSSQYNGITKSDMYDVMSDTLGNQPQYVSNFDADGATDYIIRGGNKTIINRNRGNGRGIKV